MFSDLSRFGMRCADEIHDLGVQCEREPPSLHHHDAWGNRIDDIWTCPAWRRLHDIAAEEGLISIAYEQDQEQWRYRRTSIYRILKEMLYANFAVFLTSDMTKRDITKIK